MWEERRPAENETVKVEFAEWTHLGTMIGICIGYFNGCAKIMFGDTTRFLDMNSTFFVYTPY